jgi:hypothetical protein
MSDELDDILSQQIQIIPSRGFVMSVMDEVKREATAPPPIPFPWKPALPGLVLAALGLVSLVVAVVEAPSAEAQTFVLTFGTANVMEAGWVAAALLFSLIAAGVSFYLESGLGF